MERREFLKLFGFGAVTAGAVAMTMSPAQAASVFASEAPQGSTDIDAFIKDLAEANGEKGEFAWHRPWHRPRRRWRRRMRRCWRERTRWGWRRVCRWW